MDVKAAMRRIAVAKAKKATGVDRFGCAVPIKAGKEAPIARPLRRKSVPRPKKKVVGTRICVVLATPTRMVAASRFLLFCRGRQPIIMAKALPRGARTPYGIFGSPLPVGLRPLGGVRIRG